MIPVENERLRKKKFSSTRYKKAIGSLLYLLTICALLDILFTVRKASRKSQDPTYEDWFNVLKNFQIPKR